jgi:hypothetical protein
MGDGLFGTGIIYLIRHLILILFLLEKMEVLLLQNTMKCLRMQLLILLNYNVLIITATSGKNKTAINV